ncbi:MAG: hypothetical protein ABL971_10145 [Vicinamibacterales bacterium]
MSHSPSVIATFYDRALLLDGGRFVMDGHPDNVARTCVVHLTAQRRGGR